MSPLILEGSQPLLMVSTVYSDIVDLNLSVHSKVISSLHISR